MGLSNQNTEPGAGDGAGDCGAAAEAYAGPIGIQNQFMTKQDNFE